MQHGKLTLDLDGLEVVSCPTQTVEAREEACPTASATLTPTGQL